MSGSAATPPTGTSPASPRATFPVAASAAAAAFTDRAHRQGGADLRRAALIGLLAVIVLVTGSGLGGLSAGPVAVKLAVAGLAVAFVVLGVLATRRAARGIGHLASHTSPAAGAGTRLLSQLVGYLTILIGTLGLLAVPLDRLLVGGALTGVVVGIAAQQPLSNLIAGLVLLLARPVAVGSRIRVHSGALGGPFEGTITDIGLIYTTLGITINDAEDSAAHGGDRTGGAEDTVLRFPNAALLASALHTLPSPTSVTPATVTPRRVDPATVDPATSAAAGPEQAPEASAAATIHDAVPSASPGERPAPEPGCPR